MAVKIGSIRWMPRLLPVIVRCDRVLHVLTRRRYGVLDLAGLPNLTLLAKGRRSGVVRATDTADVVWRGRHSAVAVTALDGEHREQAWQTLQSVWPNFDLYESRTDRTIPVFRLDRC